MAGIHRWEYYVETIGSTFLPPKDNELDLVLNELGEAGWEVLSLEHLQNSNKLRIVAKRLIEAPARKNREWP